MAIIGPLPNTLTNGTVADANQVMADLNFIKNSVNANAADGSRAAYVDITNTFALPQNVADAATLQQVPNAGQIEQNSFKYILDTGAANAYVVAPAIPWVAYVEGADLFVKIGAGHANTGVAMNINVSALGVKSILNEDLSTPSANSFIAGGVYHLLYDGTRFVILGADKDQAAPVTVASAATINLETAASGNTHISGTVTITAITLSPGHRRTVVFDGVLILTQGASLLLRGGVSRTTVAGETTTLLGEASGVVREIAPPTTKQPTSQAFTTGSGTYTTPSGVASLRVRLVGGGGGGGGGNTGAPVNGTAGANTTFSTFTAGGGATNAGGGGGAGGTASGGTLNLPGGSGGGGGQSNVANVFLAGGQGGSSVFGGGGGGGAGNLNGVAASTNTGGGGGGGGSPSAFGGAGAGGAGGYVEAIINGPAATYSYAVGAGGTGGVGVPTTGGAGAAGIIIVEEFYS